MEAESKLADMIPPTNVGTLSVKLKCSRKKKPLYCAIYAKQITTIEK